MRYDLEINIVGELTQAGLTSLADTFYDSDTTTPSVITPARWDARTLVETTLINKGAIDTSKYRGGKDIPPAAYGSGVEFADDISLYKYLIRDNIICPLFVGGSVYIHNYKYAWSNNTTVKSFELDTDHNYYYCDVEADVDITSIDIHTLELKYPGYMTYGRRWTYAPFIEVLDTNNVRDLWKSLKASYIAVTADNKFTIVDTTDSNGKITSRRLWLNGGIVTYKDMSYGTVQPSSVGIFGLKEFPLQDLSLRTVSASGVPNDSYTDYKYFTSVIRAKNTTPEAVDVYASWTVVPIVAYKQIGRSQNLDVVYKNINIIPNSLSFKDGLVCLFNLYGSPGGTILTDDGTNILYPFYLTLKADKTQLSVYDTVRLTAKLDSANKIPVKGAKIRFELDGDMSKFVESNSTEFTSRTGIDGVCTSSVIVKPNKFGWYVQKEWIKDNTITLPFDINHYDKNEIYVYFITNDDPVLGKAFAEYGDGGNPQGQFTFYDVLNRAETPIEEVYNRSKSFDTYQVSGRKIAYVKLQRDANSNKLYSSFVKPISVDANQTASIWYRNLFVRNTTEPITAAKNLPPGIAPIIYSDGLQRPVDIPIRLTGHRPGSLPQRPGAAEESLSTYNAEVTGCTVIKFAENIPLNDRVQGMWLITGSSGFLTTKAIFEDAANDIYIESAPISIPIMNFIKSEYEFILSDVELAGQNTAFGAFSYFTVSEHLKNPFKLNACSYACIYSDAIGKRCQKPAFAKYYRIDPQQISCIHLPDYDATLPAWDDTLSPEPTPEFKCPGLEARYVNPFILFQGEALG